MPIKANNALLLLGCPESPVQTGIALYLASRLGKEGIDVTVAGTRSALNLIRVSDPDGNYVDGTRGIDGIGMTIDLDLCIANLAEKKIDFDLSFGFIHNDAGVSYLATMRSISNAKLFAIVFGGNADALASSIDFDCEKLVSATAHNPIPLKKKIDDVMVDMAMADRVMVEG